MHNELYVKTFTAPTAVPGYTIATLAAGANAVETANAVTDALVGVTTAIGTQDNARCDVVLEGIAEVLIGGAVTKGELLTTDASGHAVPAIATDHKLGIALATGVSGDIIPVFLRQA